MKRLFLTSLICFACMISSCSNETPDNISGDGSSTTLPEAGPTPNSEGNIIYYTASDWRKIEPHVWASWEGNGFSILSNICEKGDGKIVFDKEIDRIVSYAFLNATGLSAITIPKTVVWIDEEAFSGCINLKSITLPATLTSIGDQSFAGSGLTTIYCKASIPPVIWGSTNVHYRSFSEGLDTITVYVPEESLGAYKAATDWKSYDNMIFKGYDFKE